MIALHLINGNDAIGFGHLRARRDHAHGERHLALRRPILLPTYGFAPNNPAAAPANFPQTELPNSPD